MDSNKHLSRNKNLSEHQRALLAARLKNRKKKVAEGIIPKRGMATAPLSPMQQQVWLFEELHQTTSVFHLPFVWELRGPLQVAALKRALVALVQQQPSLRTRVRKVADRVEQVTEPSVEPTLHQWSVEDCPAAEREAAAIAILKDQINQPFSLEQEVPVSYHLVQLQPELYILMIDMHHLLGDGWSGGILGKDLQHLYQAQLAERKADLPALPVTYGDYAAWLADPTQDARWSADLAFWLQHLKRLPPLPSLFEDHRPTGGPRFRGATVRATLPAPQAAALRAWCGHLGITPFAALMAAYQILLMRFTRTTDFCIGTPMANRPFSELAKVCGFFTNIVPLRAELNPAESFAALARRVHHTIVTAAHHGNLPFDRVADAMALPHQPDANPFFNTVFTYQHHVPTPENHELKWHPIRVEVETAKFPLTLEVVEQAAQFDFFLEYDRDRFGEQTIRTFLESLLTLLNHSLDHPHTSLISLPLSTGTPVFDRQSGRTHVDGVITRFEDMVTRYPDKLAVTYEGKHWTYRELNVEANRLAHWLRAQGVGPNQFVCLYLDRNIQLIQAVLAVLKTGAAYVPIDAQSNRDRIELVMNDTESRMLLVHNETTDSGLPHALAINLDCLDLSGEPGTNLGDQPQPQDRAYVLYTSGSTGRPKGVIVRHGELAHFLNATQEWFEYGPSGSWTLYHSYAFDFTVLEIWGALAFGGRLTIVPFWTARNPEAFYQLLVDSNITHLTQTPAAFAELTRYEMQANPSKRANSLVHALVGAERFEARSAQEWIQFRGEHTPKIWNAYGPTETVCIATACPIATLIEDGPSGSTIGTPHDALTTHLLDPQLRPVPDGAIGELCIGGYTQSEGYLNRPAQTAQAFIPNPFGSEAGERMYKSGDLVRRLHSGFLHYMGRNDRQVKIRGFRIELGEITACLEQVPGVAEGIIQVRGQDAGDKEIVAYYVSDDARLGTPAAVRETMKARLHPAMVPSRFACLEAFPLNQSGKIDVRALPEPEEQRAETRIVQPRNAAEDVILSIWERLLDRTDPISVHQSFFELGGQSLLAARLAARLRDVLNCELSVRDVFNAPTIADQAALVQARGQSTMPPIDTSPHADTVPVTPGQQIIWTTSHLPESAKAYHLPFAFRMRGNLNPTALGKALAFLIDRYEILRTRFLLEEGNLVQQVLDQLEVPLTSVDLGRSDQPLADAIAMEEQHAAKSFDLERPPLLRCTLYRLGDQDFMLGLLVHHIVFDGGSLNVLLDDLFTAYQALSREEPIELEPLPIQFRDFARWYQANLKQDVWANQREYWLTHLDGCDTRLAFVDPANRPEHKTFSAKQRFGSLDAELTKQLQNLALEHQVTYFHTLWSLFNLVCYSLAGQKDQTFGTPFSGRVRAELEHQVGFFVNMVPLRTRLDDTMTLSALLTHIREVTLAADDHQAYPLEAVFAQLNRHPERVSPALIEAGLAWQGQTTRQIGAGLLLEDIDIPIRQSQYDLFILASPDQDATSLVALYNADLFEPDTIDTYLALFQTIATNMITLTRDGHDPLLQDIAPFTPPEPATANPFEELAW